MNGTESQSINEASDFVRPKSRSHRRSASRVSHVPLTEEVRCARTTRKRQRSVESAEKISRAAPSKTAYLLHNPKSCLRMADLSHILNETTWALLTQEERTKCLGLVPSVDQSRSANGTTDLKPGFFTHNLFLQDAFREFQSDLQAGYLTTAYAEKSLKASRQRRQGNADAFKDEQFEMNWGDKQWLSSDSIAGSAVSITLADLIRHQYVREKDILQYSRNFACRSDSRKKKTEIRKHCELVTVDETGKTSWRIRIVAGQEKSSEGPVEIEKDLPMSLKALENHCLDVDGQLNGDQRTNGNSWKYFRLQRGAINLGLMFELRERLYWEINVASNKQSTS